jgi:hypothetical protein
MEQYKLNPYYIESGYDVMRYKCVYALINDHKFIFPNFTTLKNFQFFDDITEIFYNDVDDINVLSKYPKNLNYFSCGNNDKKNIKLSPKCGITNDGM